MKSFFKNLFASILGCFIALGLVSLIGFIVLFAIIASSSETYSLQDKTVLNLKLDGVLVDRVQTTNPFLEMMGMADETQIGLDDILSSIDKAKTNDKIKGIYIEAGAFSASSASIKEIRDKLIQFKESGKFIVSYGDVYTQGCYYLASVADKVVINPKGNLDWHGISSSPTFYKGLLEKLGIEMQVFKVGTFKSAVEPFILDKMSDANRQQVQSYANSMWGTVLKEVASSRDLTTEQLNQLADTFPLMRDPQLLVDTKMVDTLMYETDARNYIKTLADIDNTAKLRLASVSNMSTVASSVKETSKDIIAVLYAEGEITSGIGRDGITDKRLIKEIEKLSDNDKVKAVVLRVNSPGGSAYASEQIWKAVTDLKAKKPVVVSMGGVAASGGYYISCNASKIVAQPNTLTGSIGIFGMFPNVEGLTKKVGLTFDNVKTNKYADFGDITRPMRDDEKAVLQSYIEQGYDLFLTRCSDGRGIAKDSLDHIAQGRVWTGEQAIKIGLVDAIGGIDTAISEAAKLAGLEAYALRDYPRKMDFFEALLESKREDVAVEIMKEYLGSEYKTFETIRNIKNQDCIQARIPYGFDAQ